MSIRFWLNATAEKATETKYEEKSSGGMRDVSYLGDFEVKDGSGGAKYISPSVDPFDPASPMPTIDRKYIKCVSFTGTYCEGFRTDGIYKLKGATARVTTSRIFHSAMRLGAEVKEEAYQKISISAGSVRTLREIYSKVRKGELKPDEDWGISKRELALRECQVA
jgi:hypothetical protein